MSTTALGASAGDDRAGRPDGSTRDGPRPAASGARPPGERAIGVLKAAFVAGGGGGGWGGREGGGGGEGGGGEGREGGGGRGRGEERRGGGGRRRGGEKGGGRGGGGREGGGGGGGGGGGRGGEGGGGGGGGGEGGGGGGEGEGEGRGRGRGGGKEEGVRGRTKGRPDPTSRHASSTPSGRANECTGRSVMSTGLPRPRTAAAPVPRSFPAGGLSPPATRPRNAGAMRLLRQMRMLRRES